MSCCRPGRRSLVLGVFSRPAVHLTRHFHPEPLQVTDRNLLGLGVPALGYLFLISLITTGIAHTTPAVALIMVVIRSASATRAHLPVRTADRRQVIKDRGRHVRSRVGGRILEDKPRQGTYTRPALLGGGADSVLTAYRRQESGVAGAAGVLVHHGCRVDLGGITVALAS